MNGASYCCVSLEYYIVAIAPLTFQIQARVRGFIQRRRYLARLQFFRDHVAEIVRIQATWKGLLARRQYKNLTQVHIVILSSCPS